MKQVFEIFKQISIEANSGLNKYRTKQQIGMPKKDMLIIGEMPTTQSPMGKQLH